MNLTGMYRGVITEINDPSRLGRLGVSVPAVMGTAAVWAFPCKPSPGAGIPSNLRKGDGVWVMFEGGDPAFPVWMGFFGPAGAPGTDSGYTPAVTDYQYVYDSVATMADPGAGDVRTNTDVGIPSTQIAFSKMTDRGIDASNVLAGLTTDDSIRFQQLNNAANWGSYRVTGPTTNNGTWFLVPVASIEQHGTLSKMNTVLVHFTYIQ